MPLIFYVTLQDFICLVVLGYSQLTWYNPGTDQVSRHITFCTILQGESSSLIFTDLPACIAAAFAQSILAKPLVSFVSATIFLQANKLGGSQSFHIYLSNTFTSASIYKVSLDKEPPDLSKVSSKYYNFTDIYSELQANTLALYYLYNLKINLNKETSSSWRPIYFLSQTELHTL